MSFEQQKVPRGTLPDTDLEVDRRSRSTQLFLLSVNRNVISDSSSRIFQKTQATRVELLFHEIMICERKDDDSKNDTYKNRFCIDEHTKSSKNHEF